MSILLSKFLRSRGQTLVSMTTIKYSVTSDTPLDESSASFIQTTASTDDTDLPASVVIQLVALTLLWVLALLGNILVCIVIHRSKRLQSTTNYFVVSLACTDHLFSFAVVPFLFTEIYKQYWIFGGGLCKVTRMIQFWTTGTTSLILICISLDRFYTILYPLSFKITRQRAKQMIVASWIISLIFSVPNIYFFNAYEDPVTHHHQCNMFIEPDWGGIVYTTIFTSIHYFLPFLIVAVVYTRIFRFIWTIGIGGRILQRTTNPVPRTKVKMVKLIMAVNIAVFGLLSPFFIAQLWHCSTEEDSPDNHLTVFITVTFIFYISACAKPGKSSHNNLFGFTVLATE